MRPSLTPTSPAKRAPPLPSTMVPPAIFRSRPIDSSSDCDRRADGTTRAFATAEAGAAPARAGRVIPRPGKKRRAPQGPSSRYVFKPLRNRARRRW